MNSGYFHSQNGNFNSAGQSLEYLKFHIKSQFLDKLQTGDPIYDTIIAFILLSSQDVIIRYITKFKDFILYTFPWKIWSFVKWLRWLTGLTKEKGELLNKKAIIKYITEGREINTLYTPILWYLNTLTDIKKEEFVNMSTTKNDKSLSQSVPKDRTSRIEFLNHEIYYTLSIEMISIYAEREHKRENMIITLTTETPKDRAGDVLEQFVSMCMEKYEEKEKKRGWVQTVYRNEGGLWKDQPLKIKKLRKFNTVILKEGQMERLTNDVNSFLHDEEWYISRDIPYTRGYMFYGLPGTGKSSCIKALAGHTKRHIHYLILSDVKSDAELFNLFEKIPFNETILVIEDIDSSSKITRDRNEKHEEDDDEKDQNKLTLSGLLNVIDGGIIQTHGRIMIITTNHPEVLDKALIRAGRIDMNFDFSMCDTSQIRGLFFNFFERNPPDHTEFPVGVCSPADVTSILLEYKEKPDLGWKKVKEKYS